MKTVITYGVFDVFHEGHINLLHRAKALGDRLICGVCTDAFAAERGKLLLSDPLQVRLAHVAACEYVDEVIVEDHLGQKIEDIRRYHADVFVIGDDWQGAFDYLKEFCEVVYLPRTPGISSSRLRGNPYVTLRLGIIGSGRIVRRFLEEAAHVKGSLSVDQIWNPHPGSAELFLDSLRTDGGADPGDPARPGIGSAARKMHVCGSLEELFRNSDAVYIASPHGTHYPYARAALEAGLHVLCEKPMCLKEAHAKELFRLAAAHGRVLMEGIKTAYCPGFIRLMAVAQSGVIGEIRDIESCFTKLVPKGLREWTDPCGGAFTELGSYTLLPAIKLAARNRLSWRFDSLCEDGVDSYTKAYLSDGRALSSSKTGIGVKSEGQLVIAGTKGYILVPAPWWKTSSFEIRHEDPSQIDRISMEYVGDGLRYEISEFVGRIQGYSHTDLQLTQDESVLLARIMEDFLREREGVRT